MKAHLKAKATAVPFRFLAFCFTLFSLSLFSNNTHANLCQEHILNVGINLGWSVATLELRGDQNPQDARTITESLTRAAQHVNAAAPLFRLPYRTERLRTGTDQRVIDKINRYFRQAPNLSIGHRANYIANIWSMYRQSFQTTFQAPTPGKQYHPNCDFAILNVGYHFGRAHIAAGVINNNRARTYQTGANGSMRSAIESGLNIAVDGYEYGTRSNARKACCCFGKEVFWRELPVFQWNSPFTLYSGSLGILQRIVRDAGVRPKRCTCGGTPIDPPPDHCKGAIGSWRWFNGIIVQISGDYRFSTSGNNGTWRCLPNGNIEMRWNRGGWVDTLSVSPDGNSLSGRNQHGTPVSATRLPSDEHSQGKIPGSCSEQGMKVLYNLIDPPPYSGFSPICQDASGNIWIQAGGRMQAVQKIVEGSYNRHTGCREGSSVITRSRTYGGRLCGP